MASTSEGKSASDLFPNLMQGPPGANLERTVSPKDPSPDLEAKTTLPPPENPPPEPPPPPDISWLKTGELREKAKISDIPTVLVLVKDENTKRLVSEAMQEFDYQVDYTTSEIEAIEKTKSQPPTIIVRHADLAEGAIDESKFHRHISWLPMSQRRNIFYIFVSDQSKTLFNLEALSYSANLVVNNKDLGHLAVIIRKGLHDYENLFGPFTKAIRVHAN